MFLFKNFAICYRICIGMHSVEKSLFLNEALQRRPKNARELTVINNALFANRKYYVSCDIFAVLNGHNLINEFGLR